MGKYSFDWNKERQKIIDSEKKNSFKDARFWKPTVDKEGNANAVIRFIPTKDGTPFVKYHQHNFKYTLNGQQKYYIKNCISDFGFDKGCPVCAKNSEYWKSPFKEDKDIASARKRKKIYVANILVVKDPDVPENDGKVFLFSFGEKIYGKIADKMFPSEEKKKLGEGNYDEYVPFDLYEGADFCFTQEKQGEYPNYDKSTFLKQKPVGNDKKIDQVMEATYDLSEFIAEDKYPTNEDVIKELGALLGLSPATTTEDQSSESDPSTNEPEEIPSDDEPPFQVDDETPSSTGDEEDDEQFFRTLK